MPRSQKPHFRRALHRDPLRDINTVFTLILIKTILLGRKVGRGDTRHNIKLDTYAH